MIQNPTNEELNELSFQFPLTSDSIVFEVGGYKGRWAKEIAKRYDPKLFVFEPQEWAYRICQKELENANARVFNFGLGLSYQSLPMGEFETDGCSFIAETRLKGEGIIVDAVDFINQFDLKQIDLMLINIEGYEFQLLPYLLDKEIVNRIKYLMVQFHTQYGDWLPIRERIEQTHNVYFDYGPILIAWERK